MRASASTESAPRSASSPGQKAPARTRSSTAPASLAQQRFEALPLAAEGLVPVGLEQVAEAVEQRGRIVEDQLGHGAAVGAVALGQVEHVAAHLGVGQPLGPARVRGRVVEERPRQLVGGVRGGQRPQPPQLVVERPVALGEEAVGQGVDVERGERANLAPQLGRQRARLPHPRVLQRVALGVQQHVQAEHGLKEGRVGVGDALDGVCRQLKADRDRILSLVRKLTGSSPGRDPGTSHARPLRLRDHRPPAVAVAFFIGSAGGADGELLIATVGTGDGFDIGLARQDGARVTELTPGTYTIRVRDRSRLHNFHLASNQDSTVNFKTELEFVGEQDFTVTFKDRTRYAYACEPHWQTMNGEFLVISATSSPPAPKPKPLKLCGPRSRRAAERR